MPRTASQSQRRTGEQTQALILAAATTEFRERGYDVATLDDVARHLGVTRSAVLHHFRSKRDILRAIVLPGAAAVDRLFTAAEPGPLTTRSRRRQLLADVVDIYFEHRDVTAILSRDVSAYNALDQDLLPIRGHGRLVALLASGDDVCARARVLAAVGAIARPIATMLDADDTPELRATITDCAFAALCA